MNHVKKTVQRKMSPSSLVLPFSVEKMLAMCQMILCRALRGGCLILHSKNNNTTNPLVMFYDCALIYLQYEISLINNSNTYKIYGHI